MHTMQTRPLPADLQCGGAVALTVYPDIAAAQERWRAAQLLGAGYGFQTVEWHAAWQGTVGAAQGFHPCIVEVTGADGRSLMWLPLAIVRRRGLRVLAFAGGEVTDYNGPLIDASFAAALSQAQFAALWRFVLRCLPRFDTLRLHRMPAKIGRLANPFVALPGLIATDVSHAAALPATFEEFQKTRSAKVFADTRRCLRRLGEGGVVRIDIRSAPEHVEQVIAAMARQKARRWQATGSRDLFAEPGYLDFYRRLTATGIDGGEVVVSALYRDEHLIATHWGMRFGPRFYWLMPGYEGDDWARYSPGRILLEAVVRWCIDERLEVFDLTVGDEAYKRDWADTTMALYGGLFGYSLRGKVAAAGAALLASARAKARENVRLRALVRRVKGLPPAGKD